MFDLLSWHVVRLQISKTMNDLWLTTRWSYRADDMPFWSSALGKASVDDGIFNLALWRQMWSSISIRILAVYCCILHCEEAWKYALLFSLLESYSTCCGANYWKIAIAWWKIDSRRRSLQSSENAMLKKGVWLLMQLNINCRCKNVTGTNAMFSLLLILTQAWCETWLHGSSMKYFAMRRYTLMSYCF